MTDLASAIAAIEAIVEQGEGASGDNENSHYGRFRAIGEEYDQLLNDDPDFCPGRPVVDNPYSVLPQDVSDLGSISLLDDRMTAQIGSLFDACYEILMQIISRRVVHTEEREKQLSRVHSVSIELVPMVSGAWG